MLPWTKQNTMQRAMRTVLEWPQIKSNPDCRAAYFSINFSIHYIEADAFFSLFCICTGGIYACLKLIIRNEYENAQN